MIPVMELDLTTALAFHNKILPKVSRSFALTIPQLPLSLRIPIANCYLWCRITDTIEDDNKLNLTEKLHFHQQLTLAIKGKINLSSFTVELLSKISAQICSYEKLLLENIKLISTVTNSLPKTQAKTIIKCVTVINKLMPKFQTNIGLNGLKNFSEFKQYCYAVAGIVGETLTELFSEYLSLSKSQKCKLFALAKNFGQALQTTNILKDRWEDYRRNICWLPRDLFNYNDFNQLLKNPQHPIFTTGIRKLIAINYQKLKQALEYVLIIPANEIGIRKFCLWAIGMAATISDNINKKPAFTATKQIKISKTKLRLIIFLTNSIVKYNWLLKLWFKWCSRNLRNADLTK